MKKTILLFACLLGLLTMAQNQRFMYQYSYAIDSLHKDSIQTELMLLDVTPEGSKYYSKAKHDSDSIVQASLKKQISRGSFSSIKIEKSYKGEINYSVEKQYPQYKVYLLTRVGQDFKVLDARPMQWKILPEQKKIGQWNTQKASLDFAGRHWIAWFTTDIPLPEGPYKFHGLPGLIVKISSQDNTHSMELKGVIDLPPQVVSEEEGGSNVFFARKPLEISQKQFAKQVEKYRKDPAAGLRQMLKGSSSGNVVVVASMDGKKLNTADMLRKVEERKKKEMQRKNNKIELQLD